MELKKRGREDKKCCAMLGVGSIQMNLFFLLFELPAWGWVELSWPTLVSWLWVGGWVVDSLSYYLMILFQLKETLGLFNEINMKNTFCSEGFWSRNGIKNERWTTKKCIRISYRPGLFGIKEGIKDHLNPPHRGRSPTEGGVISRWPRGQGDLGAS